MSQDREIVITGVGLVSPIGIGREAYWESMLTGRSGISPLSEVQDSELPVKFGGEVKDFEGKKYVKPRKSLKVMCREIQTGYSASLMALEDAGLNPGDVPSDRMGVVLGSEMFYCELDELADAYRKCVVDGEIRAELWGEGAMSDLYPLWMLKYLPNMVACHVAIAFDAHGPNNTITLDEVSSLLALVEAADIIQRNVADVMVTGGVGTRINLTRMLYRGDGAWSHRNDDPAGACRPFDAHRDGGVIGEGAGAFVLETRAHAEKRGAKILARLLSTARAYEPSPLNQPRKGQAIRQSIQLALDKAGLAPADVGHVNAHGASTVEHDKIESQAIRDILGDVPVTAPSSYFGCLGAGSGAVEMAASVLALAEGVVPATLNYTTPDPECPVNVIHGQPQPVERRVAVVLNQAETGQAAAIVLGGV